MAPFAYLPGVALARVLGVDPRHVIDAQLLLLAAASLFAVSRILRLSPATGPVEIGSVCRLGCGRRDDPADACLRAARTYRDAHLPSRARRLCAAQQSRAAAAMGDPDRRRWAPASRLPSSRSSRYRRLYASCSPPSVRAPGACCLRRRTSSRASSVTIVSLGTYFFYPEYFTITYPLVRDTYLSWSMPAAVIFLNDATLIFAIAMVSVLLARQKSKSDPAVAGGDACLGRICRLVLPAAARLGLSLLSDGRGRLARDGLRR